MQKKGRLTRNKRLRERRLTRNERCKKEALSLLSKEFGSGDNLGDSNESDSELDGPIDIESTVTSEK